MKITVHHTFSEAQVGLVERAVFSLIYPLRKIMTDLSKIDATVAKLEAKTDEVVNTLTGLAQAIVDLKNAPDLQAAIDALEVRAQAVLDKLDVAEDAADDQLPAKPAE